jgi:hypothetical protein
VGEPVLVYEYDIRRHPFRVSVRNDFASAVWLLSAMLEPCVNLLSRVSLRCASDPDCPLDTRGAASEDATIRLLEDELAGGDGFSSDLPGCLADVPCMSDAAHRAALRAGASRALPPPDSLYAVAAANERLFREYKQDALRNRLFNDTLKTRHRLARDHQAVVDQAIILPTEGRRLEEVEQQYYRAHPLVNSMRLFSSIVCEKLNESDYYEALEARYNATRHWAVLDGSGNSEKDVKNAWCWDCDLHRPLGCAAFFSVVGRRLSLLRDRLDGPTKEERRAAVERHVREKAQDLCCAKFTDGREECHPRFCPYVARDMLMKRVGHVSRRLHETKHPSADRLGVDARVAADALHRDGHPHADCRPHNRSNLGVTDAECFAKSLVHHLGDKHGISPDAVAEKARQLGFDLGSGMMSMMRFFGATGEKKASGDSRAGSPGGRRASERSKANAEALKLLSSPRQGGGRRMQETRRRSGRGKPPSMGNSSRRVVTGLQSLEHAARRQRRLEAEAIGRAPPRRLAVAQPGSLWQSVKKVVLAVNPEMAVSSVLSAEGSLASRFAPGIEAVSRTAARHKAALERVVTRRRLDREQRGRRLEEAAAGVPHKAEEVLRLLEERQRARTPGRLLAEIPETHALSWVHEVVDFKELYSGVRRMAETERLRGELRARGVAYERIVDAHPHEYHRLDLPGYRPSVLGDFFRRLHSRIATGKDPEWIKHPRPQGRGLRRLADGFLQGTLSAPFAARDTQLLDGTVYSQSSGSIFEAGIRYVVFGTISCYLTAPDHLPSDTLSQTAGDDSEVPSDLPDGDPTRIIRPSADKLCFPAFPFAMRRYSSFRSLTGTSGVDFKSLTYEKYCMHDGAAQQVADAMEDMGIVSNASEHEVLGQSAPLRVGEGVDSARNAIRSAQATTALDRSGYLLCSVTEFGGILYSLLLVFGLLLGLSLVTCANCMSRFVYALGCWTLANAAGAQLEEPGDEGPDTHNPAPALAGRAPGDTRGAMSAAFSRIRRRDQASSEEEQRLLA